MINNNFGINQPLIKQQINRCWCFVIKNQSNATAVYTFNKTITLKCVFFNDI